MHNPSIRRLHLNEVTIEGIVTREPWPYDKDVFFRIALYRDMDMPAKPDTIVSGRDELDYTNIRSLSGWKPCSQSRRDNT
jgi:hypothetical protein